MLTSDPASRVQRAILREYLRTGSAFARLFDLAVMLLIWPLRTLIQAARLTRRVGGQVVDVRSRPVQFIEQLRFAWLHGISPQMYYQTGMVSASSPIQPMRWLQNGHAGLLSRAFRQEKRLPEINDKLLFSQVMKRNSVATPEVLARFDDSTCSTGNSASEFFEALKGYREFYVKPRCSSGGKDQLLLQKDTDESWSVTASSYASAAFHQQLENKQLKALADQEVFELLVSLSQVCELLVQPRLVNHADMPKPGGPALLAVRIMTGLTADLVVNLRAVLRLPFSSQIASQLGVDAAVDIQTGRLKRVFVDSPNPSCWSRIPPNGAIIEGVALPCWTETLELVKLAHRALPDYSFLGWDVAITPCGPVVLEANGNYGLSSLQKPGSRPLIDDQFLSVYEYWSNQSSA